MKLAWLLLITLFAIMQMQAQEKFTDSIRRVQGRWITGPDYYDTHHGITQKDKSYVLKNLETLQAMVQKVFPNPMGSEFRKYRRFEKQFSKSGPYAYTAVTYILDYYYNPNLKKILPESESNAWIEIRTNYTWFIEEEKLFKINGRSFYQMPKLVSNLNGMAVYESFRDRIKVNTIITRDNEQLLLPVTLKQYLPALAEFLKKSRQEAIDRIAKTRFRSLEEDSLIKLKTLANIEKNYPAEKRELVKTNYLKNYITGEQQKQKALSSTTKSYDDHLSRIARFLSDSVANNLNQPAFATDYYKFDEPYRERDKQNELVFINPQYIRSTTASYIPQFFVVSWGIASSEKRYKGYKEIFEKNFDFNGLKKMLNEK